jgi:hypothetical protein
MVFDFFFKINYAMHVNAAGTEAEAQTLAIWLSFRVVKGYAARQLCFEAFPLFGLS